jgi:hypothetical protein
MTIKLPSQHIFEIRKLTRNLLFELGDVTKDIKDVKTDVPLTQDQIISFAKLYDKVLSVCVVQPKIVVSNPKEGELSVEDLDVSDQTFLVTKIFEFSGLTAEAEQERKNLPPAT